EAVSQRVNWVLGGLVSPSAKYGMVLYPYKTADYPDRTEWACIAFPEGATGAMGSAGMPHPRR
ncbi:MAG TPA: hypothetical protein VHI72_11360, partial [Hyphomicrobiaceae bacterium]|nr:hypothetical protein [Hyphomicrobiaceae bacterium]